MGLIIKTQEGQKAARIGIAQAIAIEEQVRAYGGPHFQVTQQVMNRFAEAIEQSHVDVVPKIVIGGNGGSGAQSSGSVFEALLTLLLSERIGAPIDGDDGAVRAPELEAFRKEIRQSLLAGMQKQAAGAMAAPTTPLQANGADGA